MKRKLCSQKRFALLSILLLTGSLVSAQKKWANNYGFEAGGDFYFGLGGLSDLKVSDNPLVNNDLKNRYFVTAGVYDELLQLKKRKKYSQWGDVKPVWGLKSGINWSFFRADNSLDGGNESLGLNYVNIPLLVEINLGYKQGVTRASTSPDTYTGRENSDGSYTVTHNPGTYNAGGAPTSTGSFFYTGPTFGQVFKSFNYTGDPIKNSNLVKTNIAWNFGFIFWSHRLSFDFSYQKGLKSVYSGKNITLDAYMLKVGINFNKRLYNSY